MAMDIPAALSSLLDFDDRSRSQILGAAAVFFRDLAKSTRLLAQCAEAAGATLEAAVYEIDARRFDEFASQYERECATLCQQLTAVIAVLESLHTPKDSES